MNIFGSSWSIPYDNATMETNAAMTLDPKDAYNNIPYFIGIDPIWQVRKKCYLYFFLFPSLIFCKEPSVR